jgi:hypothetical protein
MHSYTPLVFIVAAQLLLVGGIALGFSKWLKQQPDKLIARHQAVSIALRACVVLFLCNAIWDSYLFISTHKLPSPGLAMFGVILALLLSSKHQIARRIAQRERIQA